MCIQLRNQFSDQAPASVLMINDMYLLNDKVI